MSNESAQEIIRRGRVIINPPRPYTTNEHICSPISRNLYQRPPVNYTISATAPPNIDNVIVPGFMFEYYKNTTDDECCICFDNYIEGIPLQMLPCDHIMHLKCLKNWYIKNRSCPMCRQK